MDSGSALRLSGMTKGWEQARRKPESPARVLLALIDKRPRIVTEDLMAAEY